MHILEFVIFLGIALPVLKDNSVVRICQSDAAPLNGFPVQALYIVGITWCVAFGVWVACVLYLLHHDPSKGQEEVHTSTHGSQCCSPEACRRCG